jgi:hypothetical protein
MTLASRACTTAVFAIASFPLALTPQGPPWDFDEAERQIRRLPPSAFPHLPAPIIRELERRGCRIPQPAFETEPRNVIQGQFADPSQTDWAVLCSIRGASHILVFWNGTAENPASVGLAKDRNFLQTVSATEIGYSRGISPTNKDEILRHYEAYGGPKPPPIRHQGINDAFIEKASVAWYFYRGQWRRLTGAD